MVKRSHKKINEVVMLTCAALLIFFAASIAVRFFTRQVLVLRLGQENKITNMIFWDNPDMATAKDIESTLYGVTDDYSINWSERYPFSDGSVLETVGEEEPPTLIEKYVSALHKTEGRIENYTQENLAGYTAMTELGHLYEKLIGWNFASFSEYNGTFQLPDGYWTSIKTPQDMTEKLSSTADFKAYCDFRQIDFLFVLAPHKICKFDEVSGSVDFGNQNADNYLAGLEKKEIAHLDLRERIHLQGFDHHNLFYRTDHHWKTETGLWAAKEIAECLNDCFGFCIDLSLFDESKFRHDVYEKWFLGSFGKKVTLAQADPDDFTLLYPEYPTSIHFSVPSIGIDKTGDFSVVYNMEHVDLCDYYHRNPYAAFMYGDRAIIRFENILNQESNRILIVHDSFADSVIPFLSLGVKRVDSIDLRYFNGSLLSYIDENTPDIVVVMYNAGELMYDLDFDTHTSIFDFR